MNTCESLGWMILIPLLLFLAIILMTGVIRKISGKRINSPISDREAINRIFGTYGEQVAKEVISSVLQDKDILLFNVHLAHEDKQTELDHVVINSQGVFIIEVKNYYGELQGGEEEREWTMIRATERGDIFRTEVRNPISQVRRQVRILEKYMEFHQLQVPIAGYVFLVQRNAPCESSFILTGPEHINRVLHSAGKNHLNKKTIDKIVTLLK